MSVSRYTVALPICLAIFLVILVAAGLSTCALWAQAGEEPAELGAAGAAGSDAPESPTDAGPERQPGSEGADDEAPGSGPEAGSEDTGGETQRLPTEALPSPGEGAEPPAASDEQAAEPVGVEPTEAAAEAPAAPLDASVPRGEPSKRESAVAEAVKALGVGGEGSEGRKRAGDLRTRVALWTGEIKVEASEAARERSDLAAENRALMRLARELPWNTRQRRISLAEARKKRADLVKRQERYGGLYDVLADKAEAAAPRLPEYEAMLEQADRAGAPLEVIQDLTGVVVQARHMVDDYRAGAGLAVKNARLAGDVLLALDPAIDAAQEASLLRRSSAPISTGTFGTAYGDLKRLGVWVAAYFGASGEGGGEHDVWRETASPLGLTGALVGIILVGAALLVGGRRLRWYAIASVDRRLEGSPGDSHEAVRWRVERGLDMLRALLVLAFAYAILRLLPLEQRCARALLGFAVAWTGYYAARPVLRLTLAPGEPRFRLSECDDRAARRAFGTLRALLVLSAVFLPVIAALRVCDYPHQDVRVAVKLLYGAIAVALLLWLINSEHDPTVLIARPGTQLARDLRLWALVAKPVVSLAAIGLLVLAVAGYLNLSAYLARGLVLTTLIGAVVLPLQRRASQELEARFPVVGPPAAPDEEPTADPRHLALRYGERIAALGVVVWLLLRAWTIRGYQIAAVAEYASRPLIDVKGTRVSVIGIVKGIAVALISYWIARAVQSQIGKSAMLARKWDEGVRHAVGSVLYYGILIAGVMTAILVAGMQLTVLAAFAGMVGIAVGFGSQDIAKNIICGLIIMLDRSINVGDYVDVAGQSGTITDISIRSITIRTHDNRLVVVPNATFYTQNVVVSSQRDKCVRVTIDLAVGGDTDFDKVTSILTETALAEDDVLSEPAPEVVFSKLAAGALNLQLIAWTDRIDELPTVQGRLVSRLWRALKDNEVALV